MTTDNGSDVLRALWQRQSNSSFSMEPDEIQKRLSRLQGEQRDVNIIVYVLCPGMAIWFAYWLIFTIQPIITRASLLLIILGMTFWVGQIWLYKRDRNKALVNSDAAGQTSCVDFYRAELVRQRDFVRGRWLWSRILTFYPGLFLGGIEPLDHHATWNARNQSHYYFHSCHSYCLAERSEITEASAEDRCHRRHETRQRAGWPVLSGSRRALRHGKTTYRIRWVRARITNQHWRIDKCSPI